MKDINYREDFPFFRAKENKNIVYLDSAATTQKPKIVIDKVNDYYINHNSNAGRGIYKNSVISTQILEDTRIKVANFINAENSKEIIFTKSATESLNLVAYSYGLNNLKRGDEVLISIAEHHANLVNWQYICRRTGATLKYFYLDKNLEFDIEDYNSKLNSNTKIVAFTGLSNVLSFDVNIKKMIELAHKHNAITVLDATQLIVHNKINVKDYNCDFLAFSGHKLYAFQGVGVLYGKYNLLEKIPPFLFGGEMIEYVQKEDSTYKQAPYKFEAGTLDIASILSLKTSIEYLEYIGLNKIKSIEKSLFEYLVDKLKKIDFVELYLPRKINGTVIAFNIKNIHPHDVAQILDFNNICIRVGHHCAEPLHRYLNLNSTCRVSISFYNTFDDIDKFIEGIYKIKEIFYGN